MFDVVRWRSYGSISDIEGKVDEIQCSPHMPEDITGEKDEPGQENKDIVVKDTAEDTEAHVEAQQ